MFNLLEQSKQLFNGEAFSYYEAASEVHIEMKSQVNYLPSETELSELIDNVSIRDLLSIDIDAVETFKYSTGEADWADHYKEFLEQCESGDSAKIKIHINKNFSDNNILSIYSFDKFWEYYGNNLNTAISFFSDCLKKHPYLRFDVFDKPVKLLTASIGFCSKDDNWTTEFSRDEALEKCENVSQFFNRTNISLTPKDFEILQSSGEIQIAEQVFRKLETLFSVLHLADTSYIMDKKVYIQFSAEYTRINYPLESQTANQAICDIFKWAYNEENAIDKFVIARNVIGAKCKNINELFLNDNSMLNSIKSNYTIFQRKTTQQYIEMKKDISNFIVGSSQQMQEIIRGLADGLKNNFIAVMMFFITTILTDSLDWDTLFSSGKISDDLCHVIILILFASLVYLVVSVIVTISKWRFYKSDYDRLKENYSTLLNPEDINEAFNDDKNLKTIKKRTIVISIIIGVAWIIILASISVWLWQKNAII